MSKKERIERDAWGELRLPAGALYGSQTQRAVQNFSLSGLRMPRALIRSLGLIKSAAAQANVELGLLPEELGSAIAEAARQVSAGSLDEQFPVDVFQTGSGTSTNMNANEVIAQLASQKLKRPVHPNDHVNRGQSSNDVIPSSIQAAAHALVQQQLLPALSHLKEVILQRSEELVQETKTGRTHLMDAMPITFGQELSGWAAQIAGVIEALQENALRLRRLPLGGTAVGTGVNTHPKFARRALTILSQESGLQYESAPNFFQGISAQDATVELSGQLNLLATVLLKISNDLRWMNSGPLAGLGEIELVSLQPGSSIMPGKVNPVIPEAVAMIAAQVMGNHVTVSIAGASGNFQLNVMLPVIALNVLQSVELLAQGSRSLADRAIASFRVRSERVQEALARNPILVTALAPRIGYDASSELAKLAYREGRPILDVALEHTELDEETLRQLLDPARLTQGGVEETEQTKRGKKKAGSARGTQSLSADKKARKKGEKRSALQLEKEKKKKRAAGKK